MFLKDNPSGIHDSATPASFELSQNYPNPFNPSTTITYSLTQSAPVRLNIYSVTGQHVRTLVDEIAATGNHSVVWDGRDDAGRGVSAGMYLYRLQAGSQMAAKKMLLLDGGGSPGIMHRPSAKAAATLTDREYEIIITKKNMYRRNTLTVSFEAPSLEYGIAFQKKYLKYGLFLDNTHNPRVLFSPNDTLSVILAEINEPLPENGIVTLISQAGDRETVTISGNGYYIREYSIYADDARRGIIATSSTTTELMDGILQVDTAVDTISAYYETSWGDSLAATIPVIGSYETVTLWDNMFASWVSGEWYVIGYNGILYQSIYHVMPQTIEVSFKETATSESIDAFISDNQLEISETVAEGRMYVFTILQDIHSVEFLTTQRDSEIIEHAQPEILIPIGPA